MAEGIEQGPCHSLGRVGDEAPPPAHSSVLYHPLPQSPPGSCHPLLCQFQSFQVAVSLCQGWRTSVWVCQGHSHVPQLRAPPHQTSQGHGRRLRHQSFHPSRRGSQLTEQCTWEKNSVKITTYHYLPSVTSPLPIFNFLVKRSSFLQQPY